MEKTRQAPLGTSSDGLSATVLRSMYVSMVRIRLFEEQAADLVAAGEIRTPCHLYIGQEAVAAGVCAALRQDDYVFGTHRSHGHYLAKGGDMKGAMAELLCRSTGCSKGRGGSMHLYAREVGILGTVPLVSATIPIAVGAALASALRGHDRLSVSFFGDGAVEEGTFHEAMNFAALKKLPVIFVCENNFYSSHLPLLERRAEDNIIDCARAHGIPGFRIDGNDAVEVFRTARVATERCRAGQGPTFIECRTYRWRGHVGPNWDLDKGIRTQQELESWMAKCPIKNLERRMVEEELMTPEEKDRIYARATEEVQEAVQFARQSPFPDESELAAHVFKH